MSDNNLPSKILIVDTDPTVPAGLKGPLDRHGVKVLGASDLETAMYLFNQNRIEVAIVELAFEKLPGLVLIQRWRGHEMSEKRFTGFIVSTGNAKDKATEDILLLKELRDIEIIEKPLSVPSILSYLSRAKSTRARALKMEEVKSNMFALARQNGKFDKAVSMIQSSMTDMGVRGQKMLIELYESHQKYPEALAIVDQILQADPNNIGAINDKGRLLLKMGNTQEALKFMERADKAAPDNIERINDMATMYLKMNQPKNAVEKMKQMIDYHPDKPDLKFDMFSKLYDFGYDEQAQTLCEETTSPMEVVRYYNNKGVALAKAGNIEGALTEYERSLKFYPKFKENYRILYNIALAHLGKKTKSSYVTALDYVNKCLEMKPTFDKAINTKASIVAALKKSGGGQESA